MGGIARRWDLTLFTLLLLAASAPLVLRGHPPMQFVYEPSAVARGEWWRLLTHPFVHVSRYHLLLDGVAVLALLFGLDERRPAERIALVVASAATSLAAASLVPGETTTYGLCGLSGVGHGLMAAGAVLSLREEDESGRHLAWLVLGIVAAKSLFEAASGRLLFDLVHLGDLGRPNRLCHLGGLVGGAVSALLLPAARRARDPRPAPLVPSASGPRAMLSPCSDCSSRWPSCSNSTS